MKGSKLLTCVAALGMVLTVGGCDGSSKGPLCNSLEEIFDSLETNGGNYHLTISFSENRTDNYASSNDLNAALSDGSASYDLYFGYYIDAYYTEDAILFMTDWDVEAGDGFDFLEVYVNNSEEGTLDYYWIDYVDETESSVELVLAYTYGLGEGEPTTWQEGFWNLTDLVEDRDIYTTVYAEGESEVSGPYTQYDMTEDVYKGLYEAMFVDNYMGWIYCWPGSGNDYLGYFDYYFSDLYPQVKSAYAGTQYEDIIIKYAGTTAYWYDLNLWQVALNDMGDWFIWDNHQTGKNAKPYFGRYAELVGNVTEVGETEITEELIQSGVDAVNAMYASHAGE